MSFHHTECIQWVWALCQHVNMLLISHEPSINYLITQLQSSSTNPSKKNVSEIRCPCLPAYPSLDGEPLSTDELAIAHVIAMVKEETPREVATLYGRLKKLRAARRVLPTNRYSSILTYSLTMNTQQHNSMPFIIPLYNTNIYVRV